MAAENVETLVESKEISSKKKSVRKRNRNWQEKKKVLIQLGSDDNFRKLFIKNIGCIK